MFFLFFIRLTTKKGSKNLLCLYKILHNCAIFFFFPKDKSTGDLKTSGVNFIYLISWPSEMLTFPWSFSCGVGSEFVIFQHWDLPFIKAPVGLDQLWTHFSQVSCLPDLFRILGSKPGFLKDPWSSLKQPFQGSLWASKENVKCIEREDNSRRIGQTGWTGFRRIPLPQSKNFQWSKSYKRPC